MTRQSREIAAQTPKWQGEARLPHSSSLIVFRGCRQEIRLFAFSPRFCLTAPCCHRRHRSRLALRSGTSNAGESAASSQAGDSAPSLHPPSVAPLSAVVTVPATPAPRPHGGSPCHEIQHRKRAGRTVPSRRPAASSATPPGSGLFFCSCRRPVSFWPFRHAAIVRLVAVGCK